MWLAVVLFIHVTVELCDSELPDWYYEGYYDKYGDPYRLDSCSHRLYDIRPGYPFFPISRPDNPAHILPREKNAYALVDPHNVTYRYRGHDYERFLISQNGYIAFGDFRQSGPPSTHFLHHDGNDERGRRVRYDMACLICVEQSLVDCPPYANVSWRISQHPDDKQIFSDFIFNASGERWIPDKMVIATYTDMDKAARPCCEPKPKYVWSGYIYTYGMWYMGSLGDGFVQNYYWDEMKKKVETQNGYYYRDYEFHNYPVKDFDKRGYFSILHALNHYQMILATATVNGETRTYIIYSYGRVDWIQKGYTMAGFIQKQKGDRYLVYGSYHWFKMWTIKGHGNPKKGVYAFRIDTWGPRPRQGCDLNNGWFITDWNTTGTKYYYDLA